MRLWDLLRRTPLDTGVDFLQIISVNNGFVQGQLIEKVAERLTSDVCLQTDGKSRHRCVPVEAEYIV